MNGNFTRRYKGENITIMKNKYGEGWIIIFRGMVKRRSEGQEVLDLGYV